MLSPKSLGDAADLTADFLSQRINPDGGFQDREGASDLYYTVFGLEGLRALQRELPAEQACGYVESFGEGAELDFIHTACLARCRANLEMATDGPVAEAIAARLEGHRTPDGGYNPTPDAQHGTAYGSFVALGAYQDLGRTPPQPERIQASVDAMRSADGGYSNMPGSPVGLTPSTAAALTVTRALGNPPPRDAAEWLLARCLPEGGFFATPLAPLPDLLSTATALHALTVCRISLEPIREPCLDFIDSLWSNQGGFYGHWSDDAQDCEYAYYGLLALGHLSL